MIENNKKTQHVEPSIVKAVNREKRLKILFLSTENPYPQNSGHHLRTFNTLKHAAEKHDVFFLGYAKRVEDLKDEVPLRKICKSADLFVIPADISKKRLIVSLFLNLFSSLPYTAQKYYTAEMRQKMLEILCKNKIDIIHFDMLHLARYRQDISSFPTVMIEHNVESVRLKSLANNSSNPVFKLFMYLQYLKLFFFEKKECKHFDICAAVSDDDKNVLLNMSPEVDIRVVPNGVDTKHFSPGNGKCIPKSIVWVGGMKNMYNGEAMEYFCQSIFPLIYKKVQDIHFLVVGTHPSPSLVALARRNPNVKILGFVDDVRPAMRDAAIFIAPMKSGGGTKLKVLNALSMAKPLVTTSVGAEGIDITDGVHFMLADDAATFSEKIIELLKNPALAKKLGTNGRKRMIEKYDWEIIGKQMDDIYNELAKRTPSEKAK